MEWLYREEGDIATREGGKIKENGNFVFFYTAKGLKKFNVAACSTPPYAIRELKSHT